MGGYVTTVDTTALLNLVYESPTNLSLRLVLADACDDAGDWRSSAFWRWTVEHGLVPNHWDNGLDNNWGWLDNNKAWLLVNIRMVDLWPYSDWTIASAFARLRAGWGAKGVAQ